MRDYLIDVKFIKKHLGIGQYVNFAKYIRSLQNIFMGRILCTTTVLNIVLIVQADAGAYVCFCITFFFHLFVFFFTSHAAKLKDDFQNKPPRG